MPVLLSRGVARLLVIDSVAAPFRCEFAGADSARRARRLQALGAELRRLSCAFRSPVLCINQVGLRPAREWWGESCAAGPPEGGLTAADPHLAGDGGCGCA